MYRVKSTNLHLRVEYHKMDILFKAIKFAKSDILTLQSVSEEGLFSPKQGCGQEALLSSMKSDQI